MSSEAKLGLLFFMVIALIAATIIYLGDYYHQMRSYTITVYFDDVKGLQSGADVRLAGVRIGRVQRVIIESASPFVGQPVAVRALVYKAVQLYSNDEFMVEQTTLVGDTFLNVKRLPVSPSGGKPTGGPKVTMLSQDGKARAVGSGAGGFAALPEKAVALSGKMEHALDLAQMQYLNEQNAKQVQLILANLVSATAQARQVAGNAADLVKALAASGRITQVRFDQMLQNLTAASASTQNITAQLDRLVKTSPLPQQVTFTMANIRQASEDLRVMMAQARQFTSDEQNKGKLQETLTSISAAAGNIERLTADLQKVLGDQGMQANMLQTADNIKAASASIRHIAAETEQIMSDPAFQTDIRESMHNVREASSAGVEAAHKLDTTLARVDQTMGRVSSTVQQFQPTATSAGFTLEGTEDAGLRADLNLMLNYGGPVNDYWLIGVRDLGDSEHLNLQRAFPLGRSGTARVGLIASTFGVGYNYALSPTLGLEAELYDPNEQFLDVRALWNLRHDWTLTAGAADVFGKHQPMIGLRRVLVLGGDPAHAPRTP